MIWTIILTFAVTGLMFVSVWLYRELRRCQKELASTLDSNNVYQKQIGGYISAEQTRREASAYQKGLYDGRRTDTLYRSLLNKYQRNEQVTVMCNGEEGVVHES